MPVHHASVPREPLSGRADCPSHREVQHMSIPAFGLGTFRLKGEVVMESVRNGLELGYRAIDTAQIYGNEAEVGQAVAASGVARDEIFLTTKIWTENLSRDKLIPSLRDSLSRLQTD